jgi:hypothetical protein
MKRRALLLLPTFFAAFVILFFSVYSASAIEYNFSAPAVVSSSPQAKPLDPSHPLWIAKIVKDRARVLMTTDKQQKAVELLALGDDRLFRSVSLFEHNKPEMGMTMLIKAEKYLELGANEEKVLRNSGENTLLLLDKVIKTSNHHKAMIDHIMKFCPEDACPLICKTGDYSKQILQDSNVALTSFAQIPVISLTN